MHRAPHPTPSPAGPRRGPARLAAAARAVLAAAILAAAGGCGPRATPTVDRLVARLTPTVTRELDRAPTRVTCDGSLARRDGARVHCTVVDGELVYPATVTYRTRGRLPGHLELLISTTPTPLGELTD